MVAQQIAHYSAKPVQQQHIPKYMEYPLMHEHMGNQHPRMCQIMPAIRRYGKKMEKVIISNPVLYRHQQQPYNSKQHENSNVDKDDPRQGAPIAKLLFDVFPDGGKHG